MGMKHIISSFLGLLFVFAVFAQDETTTEVVEKDKAVRAPFESGYLIDNQTTYIAYPKTLELAIQHKFGTFENGNSDLWGIYAAGSNIRIAFDYVVYKNVQIGYGLTKRNMTHDFNAKWTILEQTRKNTVPVAVAIYGNMGLSGEPDANFGNDYNFSGRFSYFGQVIVGRKVNDWLSLQVATSYSHYNMSDTSRFDYDKIGLHFNGRAKFSPQGSFIFNYDLPLSVDGLVLQANKNDQQPTANLSVGVEFSTSTHSFQIYAGKYTGMLMQDNMLHHNASFGLSNYAIGFTITRLWGF